MRTVTESYVKKKSYCLNVQFIKKKKKITSAMVLNVKIPKYLPIEVNYFPFFFTNTFHDMKL